MRNSINPALAIIPPCPGCGESCDDCTCETYAIRCFYSPDQGKASETVREGLTLAEAQEHCANPETKGDNWFHGYVREQ